MVVGRREYVEGLVAGVEEIVLVNCLLDLVKFWCCGWLVVEIEPVMRLLEALDGASVWKEELIVLILYWLINSIDGCYNNE